MGFDNGCVAFSGVGPPCFIVGDSSVESVSPSRELACLSISKVANFIHYTLMTVNTS